MDLMLPQLMARILDQGVALHNADLIRSGLLMMLACIVIGWCGGIGCTVFSMRAGVASATSLRRALFAKILALPMADIDRIGGGALINSLGADVAQLQQFLVMAIRGLLRSLLLLGGSVLMMLLIDIRLAAMVFSAVLLALAVLWLLSRFSARAFAASQAALDRLNGMLQENLNGILTVKAFARERQACDGFNVHNENHTIAARRAWQGLAWNTPLLLLLLNGALVLVLWKGAFELEHGVLHIATLATFVNYVAIALSALTFFGLLLAQFARAQVAARRISSIFSLSSETDAASAGATSIRGALIFERVSFTYPGCARPSLRDVSFAIEAGWKVALVGRSGSGKSTLAALIARLYEVERGRIRIDGRDIRAFDLAGLRASMGFVSQNAAVFSASIADNIALGWRVAPAPRIEAAASTAQLHDFIRTLPERYATPLGAGGMALSGGQRQRLTISRALLHRPPLLVLDACDSALDSITATALRRALHRDSKGCTCLFIAPRAAQLAEMDWILVLDEGCLVAQGRHADLFEHSPAYRALLRTGFLEAENT